MLTISGGNASGCLASEADNACPVSTSLRTRVRTRASSLFSVCSDRIVSARNSERLELIMTANCRDMIARSLILTLVLKPGIWMSFFMPALFCSVTFNGA